LPCQEAYERDEPGIGISGVDMGAISFDAVKMIALARLEHRPPRLDLQFYPHLPRAHVGRTDPRSYMGLLSQSDAQAMGVPA
jgi:hypothetical protein